MILNFLYHELQETGEELQCCDGVNPRSKPISYAVHLVAEDNYNILVDTPTGLKEIALCEGCYETIIVKLLKERTND